MRLNSSPNTKQKTPALEKISGAGVFLYYLLVS